MTRISIVIPVFNESDCVIKLINYIDLIDFDNFIINIIIVDDFSDEEVGAIINNYLYKRINSITVIRLMCNVGHQLAIKEGLIESQIMRSDYTVVMDGDGEDNPSEIGRLLRESIVSHKIIVAARGKRYDSPYIKLFYRIYCILFKLLTSNVINFGNFSVIPLKQLEAICTIGTIGFHYPATLLKSKLEIKRIKIERGKRYFGRSRMNLKALLLHGMKSFSVFDKIVIPRLIILFTCIFLFKFFLFFTIITFMEFGYKPPTWIEISAGYLIVQNLLIFSFTFFIFILLTRLKQTRHEVHTTKSTKTFC